MGADHVPFLGLFRTTRELERDSRHAPLSAKGHDWTEVRGLIPGAESIAPTYGRVMIVACICNNF